MSSLKKKKQDVLWEKKWRNLIHQKAIKEEMNKQLKASLERQKQEEEEKECTFKPQTLWNQSFKKTISFVDEFFVKLKPYIEQQQNYLNQLKELECEDKIFSQKVKEELRIMLSKAVDKEIMETIIEGYKGVRTRGMNKVKREKLDILSKMIKLEREYNCFMARENVDKKDLEECGFDCDLAAKLRNDILKESLCPNSLRDFAKIRQEINHVLEEELKIRENQNLLNEINNEYQLNKENVYVTGSNGNDSNIISEKSVDINNNKMLNNKNLKNIEINEKNKYNLKNSNNIVQITNEDNNIRNTSKVYILSEAEGKNNIKKSVDQVICNHKCNNSVYKEDLTNFKQKIYTPYIVEKDENYLSHNQNGSRKWEYTNLYSINKQDLEKNTCFEKSYGYNNKNIYLNSNYMKILKNEDANKYITSLQKDANSMNVIILNNNNNTNEKYNNSPINNSDRRNIVNCLNKNPKYINENYINAENFKQGQKSYFLDKNNYNIPNCLDANLLNKEKPKVIVESKNMYLPHNTKKSGIFLGDIKYSFQNNDKIYLREYENKDTRYIDKNSYNIKNNNKFYDIYPNNYKNEQIFNKNSFFTSNINDEKKKVPLTSIDKEKLPYTIYFNKEDCEHKKLLKNKPIINKIIGNFPIY
ncbi:conserved Plasmodium protein, unknown function [Plasmodium gallinaceum]|uniref:Uncharacterized protein n=1 Tax=Plasmodium gallinaceum TaxID=5849 RepID=A0A1J1GZA8_PLAGA|nr:conserved Plasmodium protein, unknown function [Plasmodium gallinaceum]CRG97932.1 conserved Plasmodium protein, unknown function [Plasmodium gallinaceum]